MIYSILLFILLISFLLSLNYNEYFGLPNAHNFYMNYRNYIDGNYKNNYTTNYFGMFKISDNCFSDKYTKCLSKEKNKKKCQYNSLIRCIGPLYQSANYI